MPPRINGPAPSLQQFATQADTAHGLNNRVIFRNGRLETASAASAFFTGSEARRATVNAFKRGILKEYGQTVADALSPRLDTLCARGKSLKASVVRDLLREAGATKAHLAEINRASVHSFCNGGVPGRGMDEALAAFYAAHPNLSAAQRDDMRQVVSAQLQTCTAADTKSLNDPFRLFDEISQGRFPRMTDVLAAGGELPPTRYEYRDVMPRMGGHAKDAAWLANYASGGQNPFLFAFLAEKLPQMRGIQPEGMISLDTAWRACFGEDVPPEVRARFPGPVGDDFTKRADRLLYAALGEGARPNPAIEMQVKMAVTLGVRMDRAVELVLHPGRMTQADMAGSPNLCDLGEGVTPEAAEEAVARDLNRWGTQEGIAGYEPVMTFHFPDGPREHRIQDLVGLSEEERAAYRSGEPSPKSRALMDAVRDLCGEANVGQRAVVGFGLSQAGLFLLRNLSPLTGIFRDEHSPCDISVSRDGEGNVTLRYATPPESPLDFRAEYMVRPDGSSELTAFDMAPRPAAPEA